MSDRAGANGSIDIRELLQPEAWSHPVDALELVETHVSWVVLTGAFAYKIKKPVCFDFLDASTLAVRRQLCEEELRLNRRLAGELYLDVVAIARAAGGGLRVGGRGAALEYAVRMRQFAREDELPALLARDAVGPLEIADLGVRLAAFHEAAAEAAGDSGHGRPAQVAGLLFGNLASLQRELAADAWASAVLERATHWLEAELRRLEPVIEARCAQARVRECHGDLHAGNVVRIGGRLLPFDALEFDAALRWTDVAAEIAFLHMDLAHAGHPGLAAVLLDAWLAASGDYDALHLLRLYEVHRALVRAKVDALARGAASGARAQAAEQRLRARLATADSLLRASTPTLLLMHGPSGSGKSWLSEQMVPALAAVRVRSDVERKRRAGVPPACTQPAVPVAGQYTAESCSHTYARLHDCAEAALLGRWDLIVDATFLDCRQRRAFRALADRHGARLLIVDCRVDPATLAERVQRRARRGGDASDATLHVLEQQLAAGTGLAADEEGMAEHVDTRDPASLELVRRRVAELRRPDQGRGRRS